MLLGVSGAWWFVTSLGYMVPLCTPYILAGIVFEIDKGTRVLTHSPNATHKRRQYRRYRPFPVCTCASGPPPQCLLCLLTMHAQKNGAKQGMCPLRQHTICLLRMPTSPHATRPHTHRSKQVPPSPLPRSHGPFGSGSTAQAATGRYFISPVFSRAELTLCTHPSIAFHPVYQLFTCQRKAENTRQKWRRASPPKSSQGQRTIRRSY